MKHSFHVLAVAACAFLCLGTLGCDNTFDRNTYNALSVSKAVIDQAGKDYNAGTIPQTACVQNLIVKARTAQSDAELAFLDEFMTEQAKDDVTAEQAAVTAAIASIAPLVASIQTLHSNPKCEV